MTLNVVDVCSRRFLQHPHVLITKIDHCAWQQSVNAASMTLLAPGNNAALFSPKGGNLACTGVRISRCSRTAWIAIGLCTLVGLGLRVAAARGDLWLDELWSLDLVSRIMSPDEVFWNIPHDNNHVLNSLWLFLLGQGAAPFAYRLPAIMFGTLTIVVAGWIGARTSAVAAGAASALAATSYVMVDYGSEARGYAGLILAVLLAIDLNRTAVDDLLASGQGTRAAADAPAASRTAWQLGAVILFGVCSHLTMLAEVACLAAATIVRLVVAGRSLRAAFDQTFVLFRPSMLLLLPLLAVMAAGVALHHGFMLGGVQPFSASRFADGYGGLLAMLLGVAPIAPGLPAIALAALVVALAYWQRLVSAESLPLVLGSMVASPALVFIAHVPNTGFPRYFLSAGLVLPLILAEMVGHLYAQGRAARALAICLVAAICLGQMPFVRDLLVDHRGSPPAAASFIAQDGPAVFATRGPAATTFVMKASAARVGLELTPEAAGDHCRAPAPWFVADGAYREPVPDRLVIGSPECATNYAEAATFPTALWSGRSYTVYRRVP